MIFNKITSKDKILNAIEIGFQNDMDLFQKYHYLNTQDEKTCSFHTFKSVIEFCDTYAGEFFEVLIEDIVIGFTVISKPYNILYSFAINIEHRNIDNLATWFEMVSFLLQENFTCLLYAKNERAIEFLVKNGMYIFQKDEDLVSLNYN